MNLSQLAALSYLGGWGAGGALLGAGPRLSLTLFTSRRATLVGFGVTACLVVAVKMSVSPLRKTAWNAGGSPRDVFGAPTLLTFHHGPSNCVPRCSKVQPTSCG